MHPITILTGKEKQAVFSNAIDNMKPLIRKLFLFF